MGTPGKDARPADPPPAPAAVARKGFWDSAGARIGVISGMIGLVVAVVGLPVQIRGALHGLGIGMDPKLAAEIEQSRPILEVRYVLLTDDVLGWRRYLGLSEPDTMAAPAAPGSEKARTLLALPMVLTAAADDSDLLEPATYDLLLNQTAFLLIENRGQRDATNITVHAEQLHFTDAAQVREGAQGDDYVAVLRRGASATDRVGITIPRTLAPGDAVLVPVFVSGAQPGRIHEWWMLSRTALLPDSLTFTDAVIERTRSTPVRRMVNPTLVERGMLDRG